MLVALTTLACGPSRAARSVSPDSDPAAAKVPTAKPEAFLVTAVSGPSWLHHLGLSISATRMGQMGGNAPSPSLEKREPTGGYNGGLGAIMRRYLGHSMRGQADAASLLHQTFRLSGADLYRLNCQSCHGPTGEGAPPEIKSVLDPVRGSSAALLMRRMKKRGTPIGKKMAEELAKQGEETIRTRLRNGGTKMPAFRHLRGDEIQALMTYLRQLAGAPPSPHDVRFVSESAARVGEHVIKGTCHTCHDATGPGGGRMAMMRGVIPSLASIPRDLTLSSVARQVEYGSSPTMRGMAGGGMMGGGMMGGGTSAELMPAFPYFTQAEIAAAYFYLAEYPPRP